MGKHVLHGLWVPLHELVAGLFESFEYFVEIFYRSHLEITSIVDALSLRTPSGTLRASYAIHRSAWKAYSVMFVGTAF
jgi:hypothetical protein